MVKNIKGSLLMDGKLHMLNKCECFGILMDDKTIVEIDDDNYKLLHETDAYVVIEEYPLTKETVIQLLPKRKYSIDEIYTISWYLDAVIDGQTFNKDFPLKAEEYIWIVEQISNYI